MDLGIAGRSAIVTGASAGIGREVALTLVHEGCDVLAVARRADLLEELAREASGAKLVPFAADVTVPDAASAVMAAGLDAFGRVDIVVNNAGRGVPTDMLTTTDEEWKASFELNFFSGVRLTLAAVPDMQSRRWGRLVHLASTYGREPGALFAPYGAAKAALLNFSKAAAAAFSRQGILSNCVLPGVTLTEGVADNAAATAARTGRTPEEVMSRLLAKEPPAVGRFGTVEEVAAAVVFLCSEQARWISGAAVAVDGGTLRGY